MKIAVLLYTKNGGVYLAELLQSILNQDIAAKAELKIIVRDDGSTDNTRSILDSFKNDGKLTWYKGAAQGMTKSYWELMEKAEEADYYAFAEQDDIWKPNKLSRAVKYLETKAIIEGEETEISDKPMLYCGEFEAAGPSGKPVGIKRNPANKFVDFEHSLVFSSKPGCTYVFNRSALKELRRYDVNSLYDAEYDALARNIMFITGDVVFDRVPVVLRRKSKIGPEYLGGLSGMIKLYQELHSGKVFNKRSRMAKALLEAYAEDLKGFQRVEALKQIGNYKDDPTEREKLASNMKFSTGSYVDKWFKSAIKSNKL